MKTKPTTYQLTKNPYVIKSLDVCTCHITKKDNKLLRAACKGVDTNPIVAYMYEYGYLVYVPEKDDGLNKACIKEGYSMDFLTLLNKARELKCKYVQLDSDSTTYDDLETFDW